MKKNRVKQREKQKRIKVKNGMKEKSVKQRKKNKRTKKSKRKRIERRKLQRPLTWSCTLCGCQSLSGSFVSKVICASSNHMSNASSDFSNSWSASSDDDRLVMSFFTEYSSVL